MTGAPATGAGKGVLAVLVSYNTRALTLKAIRSAAEQVPTPQVVVVDNNSQDGSADAIEAAFPGVDLVRSPENIGFGRAVNLAAGRASSRWILLLNPDAALSPGALARLVGCAEEIPGHGIYGGRTLFEDGSLNPDNCQGAITPWSMLCLSLGLTRAFRGSALFNPEGIGGWRRDCVREVDIVFGAFCLIDRAVWNRLGGFDPRYWLYGEDADLCIRAKSLTGRRPLFTPDAVAVHTGGAARDSMVRYRMLIAKGRTTVMRQHWPARWRWLVRPMGMLWAGSRALAESGRGLVKPGTAGSKSSELLWRTVWRTRSDWLKGYADEEPDRC